MTSIRELESNSRNPGTTPSRSYDHNETVMVKVISFLLVLALAVAAAWHFGALQAVGDAFDGWMRYIGVTGNDSPMKEHSDFGGSYWDKKK
jgi:hypothetical protein